MERRPKKDGSKKLANRKVGLKNIWWMNASSDWWKMDDIWESLVACTNLHMLRKASANEESSAISQKTLMGIGHTETCIGDRIGFYSLHLFSFCLPIF